MNRNDLMRGLYDIIILSCVVNSNEDITQYRLVNMIKNEVGSAVHINESTIYDAVRRLKRQQYIKSDSKELTITEEGLKYFTSKVEEWKCVSVLMNKFTG